MTKDSNSSLFDLCFVELLISSKYRCYMSMDSVNHRAIVLPKQSYLYERYIKKLL